jgi:hypothetical protein
LSAFGARLSTTARLSDVAEAAEGAGADAVVFFADDYAAEDVRETVRKLALRVTVIVTNQRAEYAPLHVECRSRVLIVPRPTWGWALLEALRSGIGNARRRS